MTEEIKPGAKLRYHIELYCEGAEAPTAQDADDYTVALSKLFGHLEKRKDPVKGKPLERITLTYDPDPVEVLDIKISQVDGG